MSPPDAHRPPLGNEGREQEIDGGEPFEVDDSATEGLQEPSKSPDLAERLCLVKEVEQVYREAHDEAIRTETVDPVLHELRSELDDAVCKLVTDWELLGEPEHYRTAMESLPGYDRWHVVAREDPETNAAFDDLGAPVLDHPRIHRGGTFSYDVPATPTAAWGRGDEVLQADGEGLLIAGGTGTGKSTLGMQLLAGRLGLLSEVLGYPVQTAAAPILYLAMDRPTQIRRLMHRLFRNFDARDVLEEKLLVWSGPLPATLNADPSVIVRLCEDLGVRDVFVDSIKDAAVKLTDDEAGGSINRSFQMCTAEGINLVALHHQRKSTADGAKAPKTLDDIYGSALIPAGMGSVLALHGQAGDPVVELHHLKQPLETIGPLRIEHDNQTGLSAVVHGFDPLQYLRNRGSMGTTAKQAAIAMFDKQNPTANEVARAKRQLERIYRTMPDLVSRTTPEPGGEGGQEAVRWTYDEASIEVLGAATEAATQGLAA